MRRILLINDYGSIMERTARMLDDMGWEVDIATSQKTALWTCNNRRPNLVVVDIEMRGGVGHEIISRIRRTDKKLFILAVTRGSQDDTLLKVAEVCGGQPPRDWTRFASETLRGNRNRPDQRFLPGQDAVGLYRATVSWLRIATGTA